jgi:iron-sulfur cluster insertion protein
MSSGRPSPWISKGAMLRLNGGDVWTFDEVMNEDDSRMDKNGVTLLIDAMSLQYLMGAEIDYKDDLQGAQFVIKNPNATTTCGCGSSFSV